MKQSLGVLVIVAGLILAIAGLAQRAGAAVAAVRLADVPNPEGPDLNKKKPPEVKPPKDKEKKSKKDKDKDKDDDDDQGKDKDKDKDKGKDKN
jgi:hypothetical protein